MCFSTSSTVAPFISISTSEEIIVSRSISTRAMFSSIAPFCFNISVALP